MKSCNFAFCCYCKDGMCSHDENYKCDYEIRGTVISEILPQLIIAHRQKNDTVFSIKAGCAEFYCRHAGLEDVAKKIVSV